MEAVRTTKTRTEAINTFLKESNLKPEDLARYLEQNHNYACVKDTDYDHWTSNEDLFNIQRERISVYEFYERLRIKLLLMRLEEEITLEERNKTKKIAM